MTTPTLADQLAALDELAGDLEARLLDAEELAAAARVARKAHAERLSREDADVIRIQLALLSGLREQLAAEAEGMPAQGRKRPIGAQPGSGTAGRGPSAAERASTPGLPGPGGPAP